MCQSKGWGYPIENDHNRVHLSFLPILVFADNFWILSKSAPELEAMFSWWFERLRNFGWTVPLEECTWMTSAKDKEVWRVRVGEVEIKRVGRAAGFGALGTLLAADSRTERELENRARRAWAAFFKHEFILCCRNAPLKSRLKLLQILVEPTLFWCAGSWNLTNKH